MASAGSASSEGVRLLSHRPSVLFKLEHRGDQAEGSDVSVEGVVLCGPAWDERLREVMESLSSAEGALLFAVRLDDPCGLPLLARTLLERAHTDWFAKFLSQGQLTPVFQPLVDLSDGSVYGREALIRGRMGKTELRGEELLEAAEAHDALFSFDVRTRAAALEAGLPLLPDGEILLVKMDPRAVLDVESSLRSFWPIVEQAGIRTDGDACVGLELTGAGRQPDLQLLTELVAAHRERGAVISLDDLSASSEALGLVEALRPDVVKLPADLCDGIEASPARRHLVGALVEVARELGCRVVAVGIERDFELEHVQELGFDLGQGTYLGQPNEEMLPVDRRLVTERAAAAGRV